MQESKFAKKKAQFVESKVMLIEEMLQISTKINKQTAVSILLIFLVNYFYVNSVCLFTFN